MTENFQMIKSLPVGYNLKYPISGAYALEINCDLTYLAF